jgi:regulator of cell morphogenesis and NO signaling
MIIEPKTRIGDIVLEYPATMRLFESRNIDYCCGGHRTLTEACAHAGKPLEPILQALEGVVVVEPEAMDPKTLAAGTLTALIDHVEARHHTFTRDELARVAPLAAKVAQMHGAGHPELARVKELFTALQEDLLAHLQKEERILFPYIRGLESGNASCDACFGTVQGPIAVMQEEHEQAGDILRELRELTRDYTVPEDGCASYRSLYLGLESLETDLHLHIYLESHLLFPKAAELEKACRIA